MSSHSQTPIGPSTDGIPLPPDPTPIFELNQAKRAKLAAELESLRSAYLEWPTVEGLEAFVEKKVEYNEMMENMIEFFRTAAHEHRVYAEAKGRAAKLAEERRLQEFQRALEGMNPAEAEAALQAERERALRFQKERETRAAALDAKVERARARYLEKYPPDN
ncbi:hypothetical protein BGY98DRAFT_1098499 [Russula aff. rugulosa BPL654]|nr:hypothetical protein BGY98DRAFT_1098499 [Russula aff. rugulosa BPL654]